MLKTTKTREDHYFDRIFVVSRNDKSQNVTNMYKYLQQSSNDTSRIEIIQADLAAIAAASSIDYLRHRDNYHYAALGASGAVAALIWPYIMYAPWNWFIFPPLPAILIGIGYIVARNVFQQTTIACCGRHSRGF